MVCFWVAFLFTKTFRVLYQYFGKKNKTTYPAISSELGKEGKVYMTGVFGLLSPGRINMKGWPDKTVL